MFKTRYIFITVVISIAGMMMFDMQQDLNRINNALENVQYTVETAVDAGLDLAMTSEDFFTLERDDEHYVSSMSEDDFRVTYWNDGAWDKCNIFAAAAYYQNHGELADEDTMLNECPTEAAAFHYMYDPTVDTNFEDYYNVVGSSVKTKVWLFQQESITDPDEGGSLTGGATQAGKAEEITVPLLDRMGTVGLGFREVPGGYVDASGIITDTLKRGYDNTYFRQTPYSLGLCYLKPAVVKVLVMSNFQQLMRYEYGDDIVDWDQASGCIETKIHPWGSTNALRHPAEDEENIVNNGKFEIDINDITYDIDYYSMDLYNRKNYQITSLLYGASTPAMGGKADEYWANVVGPNGLSGQDTGTDSNIAGNDGTSAKQTIVAKVTAHVPIHIPYTSPILQWAAYLRGESGHFGIKTLEVDGTASTSDTLTYDYTTWVGITR